MKKFFGMICLMLFVSIAMASFNTSPPTDVGKVKIEQFQSFNGLFNVQESVIIDNQLSIDNMVSYKNFTVKELEVAYDFKGTLEVYRNYIGYITTENLFYNLATSLNISFYMQSILNYRQRSNKLNYTINLPGGRCHRNC